MRAAVAEAAGRVPVVAGAGYGTALAVRYARLAEAAGADGLLAMPPYLVVAGREGLCGTIGRSRATSLPVIVYQRDNAVFAPESVVELARTDGIIGFKDGLGDLDLMQRIISAVEVPGDFLYFNGLPTAEQTQLAYRGIGITLYSSPSSASPGRSPSPSTRPTRAVTTPPPTVSSTASTGPSSTCVPRAAAMPSPSSRPACGCADSTWERCGPRCTSRARIM
ncbi:5-dehydro-4-deoxyglucarate dehydratase [Streptomyces alboniger]